MKRNMIEVGKRYSDGKGGIREVLAAGPQYKLHSSQMDHDNLQYRVIAKKRGPNRVGEVLNSTRSSFASWAKEIVD